MTITIDRPTALTATQASRSFATVLERAKHGESFTVMRNGEQVARILPPEESKPNGAAILAFLNSWEADEEGFTNEILEAIDSMGIPNERDRERMEWVDDYR